MPSFKDSTQYKNWTFSRESLDAQRKEASENIINQTRKLLEKYTPELLAKFDPLTVAEERIAERYNVDTISQIASSLSLPYNVAETAILFLKRFFLKYSVMVCDATLVMLACIYLACKVEEHPMSSKDFVAAIEKITKQKNLTPESIITTEMMLMEGIQFHFYIFHTVRALDGIFHDFQTFTVKQQQTIFNASQVSEDAKKLLLLAVKTDAMLLHPPGMLALAALLDALNKSINNAEAAGNLLLQYLQSTKNLSAMPSISTLQQIITTVKQEAEQPKTEVQAATLKKLKNVRVTLRQAQKQEAERLEQEAKQIQEAKRQEKIRKMEEQEAADEEMLLGPSGGQGNGKSMFD